MCLANLAYLSENAFLTDYLLNYRSHDNIPAIFGYYAKFCVLQIDPSQRKSHY